MLMFAKEVWIMLLARFLQGFGMGFVLTVQPMYVTEISTDNVRGATGSLLQLFNVAGVLYVYAIGPYVSYQTLQWVCLVIPLVFIAVFIFMPESPYYYMAKNRQKDAIKSLQFLRQQTTEAVEHSLVEIKNYVKANAELKGSLMDIFKVTANRKAFMISSILLAFQQLTGNITVLYHTQSIFEASHTNIDAAVSSIIVGMVQVIASCLTPFIADRLGRKAILLICSAFMSIALFALGAYFYVEITGQDTNNIMWLPLASLIIYMLGYNAGFGALSWVILSEIFSANIKSLAASIVTSICLFTGFLVSYFYPFLDNLGTYYIFWFFAISTLLDFFFILIVVFETKGLSLQEIQNKLNN